MRENGGCSWDIRNLGGGTTGVPRDKKIPLIVKVSKTVVGQAMTYG